MDVCGRGVCLGPGCKKKVCLDEMDRFIGGKNMLWSLCRDGFLKRPCERMVWGGEGSEK